MKKFTSLALIGAIIAGIAGFASLGAISATSLTSQSTPDIHETGLMIGHVTYELRGMDGQIKNYFQSDNVIVDKGTDCSAQSIFDNSDTDVCTLGTNGGFGFIAIGNATGQTAAATDTALDVDGSGNGEVTRSSFIDANITPADTTNGIDTVVSIASSPFTFSNLGTAGTSITQSGLFDASSSGNMFSIRDIPGPSNTGLPVTNTDTLSVTWTITLT